MKIAVVGGRDFQHWPLFQKVLDLFEISHIITGDARGADSLAVQYAKFHEIPYTVYCADWDKYGRAAGPIRNKQMLSDPELSVIVAFPGGRGTEHSIKVGKAKSIPVLVVESYQE